MPTAFSCPAWQCFQMQVFYTKELGKLLLERGADPCHVCRISWVKAGEEAINDPAVCPSSSVPGLGKSLGLSAGTWMCCRVAQLALLEVTPTRQFDGGFHVLQHYLAVGRAFRPQSSDEGFGRPLALLYPSLEANAHWHLGSPKRGDPSFPGTCPRALSPLDAMQTTGVTGVFGHRFSPMRRSLKHQSVARIGSRLASTCLFQSCTTGSKAISRSSQRTRCDKSGGSFAPLSASREVTVVANCLHYGLT